MKTITEVELIMALNYWKADYKANPENFKDDDSNYGEDTAAYLFSIVDQNK